uniref:Uncharacterized protein n=1 Tax=Timema shepardi TaxID=629360 RepID=A0A7R9FXX9_TIMSH|nr:unnamed protein product [Timema shepardi]
MPRSHGAWTTNVNYSIALVLVAHTVKEYKVFTEVEGEDGDFTLDKCYFQWPLLDIEPLPPQSEVNSTSSITAITGNSSLVKGRWIRKVKLEQGSKVLFNEAGQTGTTGALNSLPGSGSHLTNRPRESSLNLSTAHSFDESSCMCVSTQGETSQNFESLKVIRIFHDVSARSRKFTKLIAASAPPSTTPGPTTTDLSPRRYPDQVVDHGGELNNSVYSNPSSLSGHLQDKGSKYQSNLNEIDKSEQKSSVDSLGKGIHYEWPQGDSGCDWSPRRCDGLEKFVDLAGTSGRLHTSVDRPTAPRANQIDMHVSLFSHLEGCDVRRGNFRQVSNGVERVK